MNFIESLFLKLNFQHVSYLAWIIYKFLPQRRQDRKETKTYMNFVY